MLGLITPDTWLQTPSFKSLREKILNECKLISILSSSGERVFGDALVSTMVMILQKGKKNQNSIGIRRMNGHNMDLVNKLTI